MDNKLEIILTAREITGKAFSAVEKQCRSLSSYVFSLNGAVTTLAGAGFGYLVQQSMESTAELQKNATMAGVSLKAYQELTYAASQYMVTQEALTDGLKELNLRAEEFAVTGSGPGKEAFERLGYSQAELTQKLKDTPALLSEIINKMQGMENASKMRIADEIFGGQGGEQFVAMINGGSRAIEAFSKHAHDMGFVLAEETAQGAIAANIAVNDLTKQLQTQFTTVVASLAPEIEGVVTQMSHWVGQNKTFISQDVPGHIKNIGTQVLGIKEIYDSLPEGVVGAAGLGLLGRILTGSTPVGVFIASTKLIGDNLKNIINPDLIPSSTLLSTNVDEVQSAIDSLKSSLEKWGPSDSFLISDEKSQKIIAAEILLEKLQKRLAELKTKFDNTTQSTGNLGDALHTTGWDSYSDGAKKAGGNVKILSKEAQTAADAIENYILKNTLSQTQYGEAIAKQNYEKMLAAAGKYNLSKSGIDAAYYAELNRLREADFDKEMAITEKILDASLLAADAYDIDNGGINEMQAAIDNMLISRNNEALALNRNIDLQNRMALAIEDTYDIDAGIGWVEDYDKKLKSIEDGIASISGSTFSGQSFGNEIADGINNAVLSMQDLNAMFEKQAENQIKINKLKEEALALDDTDERTKKLKELSEKESGMITDQMSGYRQMFGTTSQLFAENSRARENMHNIEMGFAAVELAMNLQKAISNAVVSVTAAGQGDPYTAIPRVISMAAMMGGILSQIGGSLSSGGGGSSYVPVKAQSVTGSVLGDSGAASESIKNSQDFLEDMHLDEYTELQGIHDEMVDLNSNITGLVSNLFRSGTGFAPSDMGISVGEFAGGIEKTIDSLVGWLPGSSFISSIVGSIFGGSTRTEVGAQGITAAPISIGGLQSGGQVDAKSYANVTTVEDGGWFHSDKYTHTKQLQDLGEDVDRMLTNIFSDLGSSFVGIADLVGQDVATVQGYLFSIGDIDLKNLTTADEINEALSAAISGISDTAASTLFGSMIGQYQETGEGMMETAVRVATEKVVVLDTIDKLGNAFENSDVPALAIKFSQSILDIAGGLENFTDATESYYNNFYSDAEKQADIKKILTSSLGASGAMLPITREAYRAAIEAVDLSNSAGEELYVKLIDLAGVADDYYDYLEDIIEVTSVNMSEYVAAMQDLSTEYHNLIGLVDSVGIASSRQQQISTLKETYGDLAEPIIAFQQEVWALSSAMDNASMATAALETATNAAQSAKSAYISGLEHELQILEDNLSAEKSNYLSLLENELDILATGLNDSKSTYIGLLEDEISVQERINSSLSSAIDSLWSFRDNLYIDSIPIVDSRDYALANVDKLVEQAMSGDTDAFSDLPAALDRFIDTSKNSSRGFADYSNDVALAARISSDMEAAAQSQITEADEQANLLQEIVNAVDGVSDDVVSMDQARANYEAAKAALDMSDYQSQIDLLTGANQLTTNLAQAEANYNQAKTALETSWYESEISALTGIQNGILDLKSAYLDAAAAQVAAQAQATAAAQAQAEAQVVAAAAQAQFAAAQVQAQAQFAAAQAAAQEAARKAAIVVPSVQSYFAANPDVYQTYLSGENAAALGNPTATEYVNWHMWAYGSAEGRTFGTPEFEQSYLAKNPDIAQAIASGVYPFSASMHYFQFGKNEGREYAKGGIASGPVTGYTATLHGIEGIVPLENGYIPVKIIDQPRSSDDYNIDLLANIRAIANARSIPDSQEWPRELMAEIKLLRKETESMKKENEVQRKSIAISNLKIERYTGILEDWNDRGMPATRTA